VANGQTIRLGDIARVTRGPADPAQPIFRVNGRDGIGVAIAMRKGGDVLALGRNVEHAMAEITANLPVGIEPTLVADQPVTVEHAVDDFMEALWEAVAIVLAVSLVSLGLRAGAVVAIAIPLVLAAVFVAMMFFGIDLQRISLGALIIALGLLVDDAMITVESMVTRLEHGDDKEHAATFAYSSTAFPMLTGTLVTVAGFVPIGFARSAAGEYTFSIFAVVAIALIISWIVAVLFAPLLGIWVLKKPRAAHSDEPGPIMRTFRRCLELLRVLARVAHADIEHHLEQPRHLVRIAEPELLQDARPHGLLVVDLEPRLPLRSLGRRIGGAGGCAVPPLAAALARRGGLLRRVFLGRVLLGCVFLGRLLFRRLVRHSYRVLGIGWSDLTAIRSSVPSLSFRRRIRVGSPLFGSISIAFE